MRREFPPPGASNAANNVVVFEVSRGGLLDRLRRAKGPAPAGGAREGPAPAGGAKESPFVGHGRATDEACIEKAWSQVSRTNKLAAHRVRAIYSEWQPSPDDSAFIALTFPEETEVTYSFLRPQDGNWDEAMAEAQQTIAESMSEQRRAEAEERNAELLAVLRDRDELSDEIVNKVLATGVLLCLAQVTPTEKGTLGAEFLLQKTPPEDLEAAWTEAGSNAARGLSVSGLKEGKDTYIVLERSQGLASSILADPAFVQQASEWLGTKRFHVGWMCRNQLLLWDPECELAQVLEQRVLNSAPSMELKPAVLEVHRSRITVHARCPSAAQSPFFQRQSWSEATAEVVEVHDGSFSTGLDARYFELPGGFTLVASAPACDFSSERRDDGLRRSDGLGWGVYLGQDGGQTIREDLLRRALDELSLPEVEEAGDMSGLFIVGVHDSNLERFVEKIMEFLQSI